MNFQLDECSRKTRIAVNINEICSINVKITHYRILNSIKAIKTRCSLICVEQSKNGFRTIILWTLGNLNVVYHIFHYYYLF